MAELRRYWSRALPEHRCGWGGCGKRATVEIMNYQNAVVGRYCGPCSKRRLRELNARAEAAMGEKR